MYLVVIFTPYRLGKVLHFTLESALDIVQHPNIEKYPRQKIMIVGLDGYAFLVPFVEETDYIFLKTIIPSRKATRDFIGSKE